MAWPEPDEMKQILRPLFTARFLKFCTVGFSGVAVNLAFLALFADLLAIQANLASALAIEVSIVSNFLLNELWTFRDRTAGGNGMLRRALQFHLVSITGGAVQWSAFVAGNVVWLALLGGGAAMQGYFAPGSGWLDTYVAKPIARPPDVGEMKYASQLFGICLATFWNFFVNFYWTWKAGRSVTKRSTPRARR